MNANPWIRGVVLAASVALVSRPIDACSLKVDEPLWQAVHDAEAIVLASVISVDPGVFAEDKSFPENIVRASSARVRIVDDWKGEIDSQVEILWASLEVGDTVPLFLLQDEESGQWVIAQTARELLNASRSDLDIFAERVQEAVAIQEKREKRIDRMEWIIRCAENRVTRRDALTLLDPPSSEEEDEGYDDGIWIHPSELLTDEQRDRIVRGFIRDPQVDYGLPVLIELLADYRDDRFDRTVVAEIDRELRSEPPEIGPSLGTMAAMLTRWGVELPTVEETAGSSGWFEIRRRWDEEKVRFTE